MKKLSKEKLIWLKLNQTRIIKRLKKRRFKSKRKSKNGLVYSSAECSNIIQNLINSGDLDAILEKNYLSITMPSVMNLNSAYRLTIAPILAIRAINDQKKRSGCIRIRELNFNDISFISPAAGLLLAAELYVWKTEHGRGIRAKHQEWAPHIKIQLLELGLFELLNLPLPKEKLDKTASTISILKYKVGYCDNVDYAKTLRQEIEEIVGKNINRYPLFQGLSEAITNVSHHAYPKLKQKDLKKWWMTASYNSSDKKLKIVFCDRGITIPQSLPTSKRWETAREYAEKFGFNMSSDAHRIKAAMEMGRTETAEPHRGKGLRDFLDFVQSYDNGFLAILSRGGLYKYAQEKVTIDTLPYKLPGTLIVWEVRL